MIRTDSPSKTTHRMVFETAARMQAVEPGSVHLVVTSPPYPMIEMWDESFRRQSPSAARALDRDAGFKAFEAMHEVLDPVWEELFRVLSPGGFACINIGDATRTIDGRFALYPNHSRILNRMVAIGFTPLPAVLWRKQTNAPNKFMGSGMLPAGAYVTLEHEYVLILRKGEKRGFPTEADRLRRRRSAFFWEERNIWFSDIWMDLKGTVQGMVDRSARTRSGAFPFELPYRLIHMYSLAGDTVLDPFLGIGTTICAAMAAGRNSIGYELEKEFREPIRARIDGIVEIANLRLEQRLERHREFIEERIRSGKVPKYTNAVHGFPVVTRQEVDLGLPALVGVEPGEKDTHTASYSPPAETGKAPIPPKKARGKKPPLRQSALDF